jgi:hypothetical protein
MLPDMILRQVDRGWQNDNMFAASCGETAEEIVSGHNCRANFDSAKKFHEIFPAQRQLVLLLPKHESVVKIENDSGISGAQHLELKSGKTYCSKEDYGIVPARFSNDAKPVI